MHLIPTEAEILALLRRSGALRDGHFECASGVHSSQYLETALAMRYYTQAKTLSVGLSRIVRGNSELRPLIPDLSIVAATPAGLPVAYGLCEALRARQVYWVEREKAGAPMHFRQFLEQRPGEPVLLVDDILRSGKLMHEARALIESRGARVVGVAVLIHQPTPQTVGFDDVPMYYLARLQASYYSGTDTCEMCRRGVPLQRIEAGQQVPQTSVTAGVF